MKSTTLFDDYEWPGNVRELEHIIEGAMNLLEPGDTKIAYITSSNFI